MAHTSPNYRSLVHTPAELAGSFVQWAERIQQDPGITWGVPAIDKRVIPMRPGELVGLIGRPGHAKTSLLAYFAREEAKRIQARGKAETEVVVYVTWEQSAEELEAFFQTDAKDGHSITDIAWGRVNLAALTTRAIKRVHVPIWIIGHGIGRAGQNMPRMTPDVILGAIETMRADFGVSPALMLFDYIQLIPVRRVQDRMQQVTEVPIRVKELALRLGCPALVGVQASREVDKRDVKIPGKRDAQWACVAGATKLIDAQTGHPTTAKELYQSTRRFAIHCLDEKTLKMQQGWIELSAENPPEPVYQISVGNAGNICVNRRHRFYSPVGWKRLYQLREGDWIAVAKTMPIISDKSEISENRAYVLGLLLGDGTLTRSLLLSNSDPGILQGFREAVEKEWPGYTTVERKQTAWNVYDSTIRRSDGRIFPGCNEPLLWAKRIGIFGQTAKNKHVPDLQLGDKEVAALLSGLFSADGGLSFRNDRPQISFFTCSPRLADDVCRLLLRLGISSTCRIQCQGERKEPLYCLRVSATDLKRFASAVRMTGRKGQRLDEFLRSHSVIRGRSMGDLLPPEWNMHVIDVLKQHHLRTQFNNVKGRAITRGRMLQIAEATRDDDLTTFAKSDLAWHKITAITPAGIDNTYDFCVPDFGNFVADRFIVHNSSIEQTCDKLFGLWRPVLTEKLGAVLELGGRHYRVDDHLLIIKMLKQRGDQGVAIWGMYFDPARLTLGEMQEGDNAEQNATDSL